MYIMLPGSRQVDVAAVPHLDSLSIGPLNSINTSSLSLSVANFCSVKNKQAELQAFLVTHNLNIIMGTESHLPRWLNILNSEVFPGHYQIY